MHCPRPIKVCLGSCAIAHQALPLQVKGQVELIRTARTLGHNTSAVSIRPHLCFADPEGLPFCGLLKVLLRMRTSTNLHCRDAAFDFFIRHPGYNFRWEIHETCNQLGMA